LLAVKLRKRDEAGASYFFALFKAVVVSARQARQAFDAVVVESGAQNTAALARAHHQCLRICRARLAFSARHRKVGEGAGPALSLAYEPHSRVAGLAGLAFAKTIVVAFLVVIGWTRFTLACFTRHGIEAWNAHLAFALLRLHAETLALIIIIVVGQGAIIIITTFA